MALKPLRQNWDAFSLIADPTRRKILDILKGNEKIRVSDLADALPEITRPAVSKQLRILREYGMVKDHWAGRECYYSLDPRLLVVVREWISGYESFWGNKLAKLKRLSESDVRS